LPQNKAEEVKKLQERGNIVAMVGDGINDSPALVQSDLGIVMASGADVALESGSIIIMNNDLDGVITAIKLSMETVGKIKQNMFFALFYNILGIPVAARVFVSVGLVLKPELAGLAMALSSVSVVSNSLLLKGFNPKKFNFISRLAPIVMTVGFLLIFWQFAVISSKENLGVVTTYVQKDPGLTTQLNWLITKNESKVAITNEGVVKLFLKTEKVTVPLILAEGKPDSEGTVSGMIIGSKEAEMMRKEKLFSKGLVNANKIENINKLSTQELEKLKEIEKYIEKDFIGNAKNISAANELDSVLNRKFTPKTIFFRRTLFFFIRLFHGYFFCCFRFFADLFNVFFRSLPGSFRVQNLHNRLKHARFTGTVNLNGRFSLIFIIFIFNNFI